MGLSSKRLFGAVALATAILSSAASAGAASGSSGGTSSTTSTTTTTLPISFATNATATIAVSHLPRNFNPWTPAGSDPVTAMVMEQVWPQASMIDDHLNTEICTTADAACPSSLLVSAEPISIDPLTIEYQIAKGATWSDGVPITGADFAYLRAEVIAQASSLPAYDLVAGYEDIRSITSSSDGKTVTVVFTKPFADWQGLFTNLVPSHIAIADGFSAAFTGASLLTLVSGGPYEITHVIAGREVVLAANPNFWGDKPRIARLIFRVEPNEDAVLRALADGKVTIAQLPPGPQVSSLVSSSTFLVARSSYSPVLWQLDFNLADPVVGSSIVREAIVKAIDRHQLLADTVGLLIPTSLDVGNRIFGLGTNGGQGNDSAYAAVDDADADELLSSAGYHLDADGIAEDAAGKPLVLSVEGPSANPLISSIESELQAELLQAGIELRIANQPEHVLLGRSIVDGDYQMALVPYEITPYLSTTETLYTDPFPVGAAAAVAERAAAVSSSAAFLVSRDVTGLNDPKLAPLYAEAMTELSPSAMDGIYNEIDIELWQDLPTLPLLQMPTETIYNHALQGVSPAESATTFLFDAQNWSWELNAPPTQTTTTTTTTPSRPS